jgi:hypothetical protein
MAANHLLYAPDSAFAFSSLPIDLLLLGSHLNNPPT